MGMTGSLSVEKADFVASRHDHLVLRQKERCLVFRDYRMFGRVRFSAEVKKPAWEADLPPEILSAAFTLPYLTGVLKNRRGPLKAFLLDQRYFPGIGNWMADEVLWLARIAPQQAVGSAPVKALHRALREVCRGALRYIPKEKNGAWGALPKNWLFDHRWEKGGDCPRCGKALRHATVGGRTTCWCPACQPALAK
jgi:formamidopyrimidine-DNA glycosylase